MPNPVSAREAYQLLKDIALGVRTMTCAGEPRWRDSHCAAVPLTVDGWRLTLFNDGGEPGHCVECIAPDGRAGSMDSWGRHGTDPLQLLSRWEREQLELKLSGL